MGYDRRLDSNAGGSSRAESLASNSPRSSFGTPRSTNSAGDLAMRTPFQTGGPPTIAYNVAGWLNANHATQMGATLPTTMEAPYSYGFNRPLTVRTSNSSNSTQAQIIPPTTVLGGAPEPWNPTLRGGGNGTYRRPGMSGPDWRPRPIRKKRE